VAVRAASASGALAALLAGCGGSQPAERAAALPPVPAGVTDGCREATAVAMFPVLCPTGWPDAARPSRVRLNLMGGETAYLLEAQTGFGPHSPVFHVLFGGQTRPFRAGFEGDGRSLRITTRRVTTPVHKGGVSTGKIFVVSSPTRRVGMTRVHGRPAAIMKAPPYPTGGIHGDHAIVMWNERGHGYLVSTHSETSRPAATRTAIEIARSTQTTD
jgi:hypothetical protein